MSTIQRKSKKEQPSDSSEIQVQETIEIPLPPQPKKKGSKQVTEQEPVVIDIIDDDSTPSIAVVAEPKPSKKEKGSSKQKDATPEVVDDDSTPSIAVVVEPKPSKKEKGSASKSDETVESESVEPAPKKGKGKKTEISTESSDKSEVVKKQPPKSLVEQMTNSVETLNNQVEKMKVLIDLKEALPKHLTPLIASRKKELKKKVVGDESDEDQNLQFLEKQKESLKDEISTLKLLVQELSSVSKLNEKATKQLDSKKKKSDEDPSKPKKTRSPIFVPVSTDSMTEFILQNLGLKSNNGPLIFEQTPERNLDGRLLVETTQLMQLIHAYIRDKSLKKKDCPIELDEQLKPLFSAYLLQKQKEGIANPKLDSTSVMSVVHYHVEKKLKE